MYTHIHYDKFLKKNGLCSAICGIIKNSGPTVFYGQRFLPTWSKLQCYFVSFSFCFKDKLVRKRETQHLTIVFLVTIIGLSFGQVVALDQYPEI